MKDLALSLALILVAVSLRAQEPKATLDLQTANGQTTFHIGERIPLRLVFTSPNDTQYLIMPWGNNRGGEFDSESFDVSPSAGWSDPLTTYFAQDLRRTGHGWSPLPLLKSKPVAVALDLNQWVRFDQPGVYRVRAASHRAFEASSASNLAALQSNAIELHIVPATPEWQEATLKASLGKLDEGAIGDLRYLATPAAIDEMTGGLREGYGFPAHECSMGLIGLPASMLDIAVASMNRRIEEPDFPISSLFFSTMSLLHATVGSPAENIREQRQSFEPVLWQTVFASVPKKDPAARAQTVQTLLTFERNFTAPEIRSKMASLLAISFLDLDQQGQTDDLRQHWDLLRSPDFLPTLHTIAKRPGVNDVGPYSREDLKSVAFKRWYELDPAGAHAEILTQIGSATPSLSARALAFLPAESLPEFESVWAQAFARTADQQQEDVLGSLLIHFGTGAATSQMIAKLDQPPSPYSCMARALAFAYLVRFSPADVGARLNREIATGDPSGCNNSLLQWVSDNATAPVLNEVAVKALNNADPGVLLDALQYLKSYGTKSDEKPIWNHYVKWTRKWVGKGYVFDHPGPGMHPCGEVCTGEALATTLLAGQGWFADSALISRVLDRCIGKEMCKQLQDTLRSATPPYRVTLPNTADPLGIAFVQSFNLAQYAPMSRELLDAKILQYPPGTKFTLSATWPVTGDQRKLEEEVEAIFQKDRMSLERPAR